MFLLNSAFFLLSSIGVANTFSTRSIQLVRPQNIFKDTYLNSITLLTSKRRKDIEIDGIIDTTKKLLSIENSSTKKQRIKSFQPKTENQKAFIELMRDDDVDIVIAIGPAGTGKTMLACYAAVEALRLKKINKIIVTRPVVSVDEELGFLPGNIESKMDPWTRPIFDILRETYSAKEIEKMTEEGVIEIVPLGFMRGRTFKNAWIIADEMQNSSPTQMFMLATRIGEGSKMIITGDLNQSDLDTNKNGLLEIYQKVKNSNKTNGLGCVRCIELDKEDVQRSRAAKVILDIYESSNVYPISRPFTPNTTRLLSDMNHLLHEEDDQSFLSEYENRNTSSLNPLTNIGEIPTRKVFCDMNDDAALIPLKHMKKLNRG